MRVLWKWTKRLVLLVVVLVVVLLAPIGYVETACRGDATAKSYDPILQPEHRRLETRTFMTYPEWHIVHAYDDYAETLRDGDPHDYSFTSAVLGFWSSLCALSETSAAHGEVDGATKQMVYVIGVSFTLEMGLKAAYEETLGRIATMVRGPQHSPLDRTSAAQAAEYAEFLQQVPWYKWHFLEDAEALANARTDAWRDRERNLALSLEYRAKAAYAQAIAAAVENVGGDKLTLRMIVADFSDAQLAAMPEVSLVARTERGAVIETPRYRALTGILRQMAESGAEFVEIAGNDDIMFTALSDEPRHESALFSARRQGHGDTRHLVVVRVADLAQTLRQLPQSGLTLEHIHDY